MNPGDPGEKFRPSGLSAARACALVLLLVGLTSCATAEEPPAAKERVLVDYAGDFDVAKLTCNGAKAELVKAAAGPSLRLKCGHTTAAAGALFRPPGGSGNKDTGATWDLRGFGTIVLSVTNAGRSEVTLNARVQSTGSDGAKLTSSGSVTIKAGETRDLKVSVQETARGPKVRLFGMDGYPPQMSGENAAGANPSRVSQVAVFVSNPAEDHVLELGPIRASNAAVDQPKNPTEDSFFPFVDSFGQFIHAEWPGKTHTIEELKSRIAAEAEELSAHPPAPVFNAWGGWKDGPQLEATGFFRVEKRDGKWWLVDPDGRLFFSMGMDCVKPADPTPIDEREAWFKDFPGKEEEFKDLLGTATNVRRGYYQGLRPATFNFALANLRRKYGEDWEKRFGLVTQDRLRSWGFNTIGAWSSDRILELRKTPYTVILPGRGAGSTLESTGTTKVRFPDPYDPEFEAALRKHVAAEAGKSAGDPWCLGYFVDNELPWGDDLSLAMMALSSPPDQPAKLALIDHLKSRYAGIAEFNAAWGTKHDSWDALLQTRGLGGADRLNVAARKDLGEFYTRLAEKYFEVCRDALRSGAPRQLYLGCRFAGGFNERATAAAAKYCDVVSFNVYTPSVESFQPRVGDRPLLVGEFHFGALDRGMFHGGLVPVKTQAERAARFKSYVESALKHSRIVGVHWFQYMDQPVTGRALDGENYQIGFLDVADTPYPEMVKAARQLSGNMYATRGGRK